MDIYYQPQHYWSGIYAFEKLATKANVSKRIARRWLEKQAIWQIFYPKPKFIPRPTSSINNPLKVNEMHQADLMTMPWDPEFTGKLRRGEGKKDQIYCLTVIDVGSRYKEARALMTKTAMEVNKAFKDIYKNSPLEWPEIIKVDGGKEFKGFTKASFKTHGVEIQIGEKGYHRAQGVVERFNRTLGEQLFKTPSAQEFHITDWSTEWVNNLPIVIQ